MGTQQILMIVLSVIIVGIAVGVGITMFQNQAISSNRQAVIADLNNFAAQAIAWYKIPKTMGGGGNGDPGFVGSSGDGSELVMYIGFENDGTFTNGNGTYGIGAVEAKNVTITGEGTEVGQDGQEKVKAEITITVDPTTGVISDALNIIN